MKSGLWLLVPTIIMLTPAVAGAEISYEIDLADDTGSTVTISVSPDVPFVLTIRNKLPNDRFTYDVLTEIVNEPLTTFTLTGTPFYVNSQVKFADCPDLPAAYEALMKEENEKNVAGLLEKVSQALNGDVDQCDKDLVKNAKLAVTKCTTKLAHPTTLKSGQRLEVKVVRHDKKGGSALTWSRIYSTGSKGAWRIGYGVVTVFRIMNKNAVPFSDTSKNPIVIGESRNRDWLDIAPIASITWLARRDELKDWTTGPFAGFGINESHPIVVAGWQWTFNQEYTFLFGLGAHSQKVLLEKYHYGQTLPAEQNEDQLTKTGYRINPVIGLTVHFSSSPFATKKPAEPPAAGGGGT